MNSKRLLVTTAMVFALFAFGLQSPGVWAQSGTAACRAGWEWNKNSFGQDPCAVSTILDAACLRSSSYTIPPLNSTQSYDPPQNRSYSEMECYCNTVVYSLYMACATCQGGQIYSWLKWRDDCPGWYLMKYSYLHEIPEGTAIPRWAFYNVTSLPEQTYNDAVAMAAGQEPEERYTTTRPPMPTLPNPSSRPTNTSNNPDAGRAARRAARRTVIRGVVGGVVSLVVLVILGLIIRWRRKRGGDQPPPLPPHTQEVSKYSKPQPTSPVLDPIGADPPHNPHYNPEDPKNSPPSMGEEQGPLSHGNPSPPQGHHGQGQGRHTGVPEV